MVLFRLILKPVASSWVVGLRLLPRRHGLARTRGAGRAVDVGGAHVLRGLGQSTLLWVSVAVGTVLLEVEVADKEDPCGKDTGRNLLLVQCA